MNPAGFPCLCVVEELHLSSDVVQFIIIDLLNFPQRLTHLVLPKFSVFRSCVSISQCCQLSHFLKDIIHYEMHSRMRMGGTAETSLFLKYNFRTECHSALLPQCLMNLFHQMTEFMIAWISMRNKRPHLYKQKSNT